MPGARDGQLRIRRGDDSPPWALQMFDDALGLWLTLAQANVEEDLMLAGVPILRGPYVVNFSDIPHDGDTKTLWTPEVGDVLLRLFVDVQTLTQFDHGRLDVGQHPMEDGSGILVMSDHGQITQAPGTSLDLMDAIGSSSSYTDASGVGAYISAYVFHSADPLLIVHHHLGSDTADATIGHVELYSLVSRAVGP